MKKINLQQGIAPLVILLIITLLAGGGSAVYLKSKNKPINLESAKEIFGISNKTDSPQTIDDLTLDKTSLDFSFSSMPTLEISSFNIDIPQVAAPKIGSVGSVNLGDFGISKDSINLEAPKMNLDASSFGISIPSNIQIPAGIIPTAPSSGETAPSSGGAPSVDCDQFSMVPSCSYIQSYGQQAYDACKKCFPDK